MGGRPRKPRTLKLIQGTFRADRNPGNEPEPSAVAPDAMKPPGSLNKWGRKFWDDHLQEFTRIGLVTSADMGTFELAAQTFGQWKEAEYEVNHDEFKRKRTLGQYMKSRDHNRKNMPELIVMEKARVDFVRLSSLIGMNPVSRNRIDIPLDPPKGDPMEDLIAEND